MKKALSYDKISEIYDHIMSHVDYDMWTEYMEETIDIYHSEAHTLLDVACGTGTFIEKFSTFGFECHGVELSEKMIEKAREKTSSVIFQGNMKNFSINRKFDVVTCFFDSVNYLKNIEELILFLNNVSQHLDKNGIFIFDVATRFGCQEHFAGFEDKGYFNQIEYQRRAKYDFDTNFQYTEFLIREGDETYKELHKQYIFEESQILEAILSSDLELLASYSDFSFEPLDDEAERAHFVLGKK
jgi:predicted TPR repeat methyltransferase